MHIIFEDAMSGWVSENGIYLKIKAKKERIRE
jgi:hypothetical protein